MVTLQHATRSNSLPNSTCTPVCNCEATGWLLVEGRGVRECSCRAQARLKRKLEQIPSEYERLRLEEIAPDLKRHPKQALIWRIIKIHPDHSYLICGRSGAGKSAVMWVLYRRAVEENRPAVAMSLAELIEDYHRAEIAKYEDEYLPQLAPASLQAKSERWFIGIDDFHIGRPTRFAGEMIYRLLDAAYSYRHQLVVTSQIDKHKLEQHWGHAGEGYGSAIMRRVLEIEGAAYLTIF
ncbi:MAG: hypothetical protein MOB07_17440 [Acidobacteria bacterium]|nr:hypothetical protein [Acidobacteriota bacterium]